MFGVGGFELLSESGAVWADAVDDPDDGELLVFCGVRKVLRDGAREGGCGGW